jgi:hypothetical protein
MTDLTNFPDDQFQLPEAPDEYKLAPKKSEPPSEPAEPVPTEVHDDPPSDYEDRQFSLGELLGLVACLSIVLSILSSIAHWMGWANSPASLAAVFALAFGIGTFFGLVYLASAESARPIARVGLWVMLGGYILCAACAAFLPK